VNELAPLFEYCDQDVDLANGARWQYPHEDARCNLHACGMPRVCARHVSKGREARQSGIPTLIRREVPHSERAGLPERTTDGNGMVRLIEVVPEVDLFF